MVDEEPRKDESARRDRQGQQSHGQSGLRTVEEAKGYQKDRPHKQSYEQANEVNEHKPSSIKRSVSHTSLAYAVFSCRTKHCLKSETVTKLYISVALL